MTSPGTKGTGDDAEGQGCGDLRSRRRHRRCCRTRLCVRGAKLFLTGHHLAPVEAVAKDIVSAGGSAEAAEVDVLDEQAVDKHLQSVIDKAGRVDISFNAIGSPDSKILGVPLVELDVEQFSCRSRPTRGRDRAPSGPADGSEQIQG